MAKYTTIAVIVAASVGVVYAQPSGQQFVASSPSLAQPSQHGAASSGKAASTAALTNITKGNTLIVACFAGMWSSTNWAIAVTDSQGNTFTNVGANAVIGTTSPAQYATIFTALVTNTGASDAATCTISGSATVNTTMAASVYEIVGLVTGSPVDQTNGGSSAGSGTPSAGSINTTLNEFAIVAVGTASGTITAGNGWLLDSGSVSTGGSGIGAYGTEYRITNPGSVTCNSAVTGSPGWATVCASFHPALQSHYRNFYYTVETRPGPVPLSSTCLVGPTTNCLYQTTNDPYVCEIDFGLTGQQITVTDGQTTPVSWLVNTLGAGGNQVTFGISYDDSQCRWMPYGVYWYANTTGATGHIVIKFNQ